MFMFSTSLYANRFNGCTRSYRRPPSIIIIMKFFISHVLSQPPHGKLVAAREHNTQFMNNIQKHFNTQKTHYTKSHLKTALIIL